MSFRTRCPMITSGRDEWESIVPLIHRYAQRKYGRQAVAITIHFHPGGEHQEPLPPGAAHAQPPPGRPRAAGGWASGDEPKHLWDFQQVYWPGLGAFHLTPKQAAAVEMLWDAWENSDAPEVAQSALLAAADSDCARLLDLFRSRGKTHPAWGKLILPGGGPATYRLPELPAGGGEDQNGEAP